MTVYESSEPRGGGVLVATGLAAIVTAVGVATRPLLAIDETRYAAVALEMFERHEWLVPYLNGAPYSHKPPLLFWLVLGGWKLFGVSTLWARLVAPLAGILALSGVAALARTMWPGDTRSRKWAPLITGSALVWAAFGSLFMFDTLLACSALLGLVGIFDAVERGRARGVFLLGLAITLGVLAKGPVILVHVLPAALLAPWWATPRDDRRWRSWYAATLGAVALGAVGALLWAVPAGMAGGEEYQRAIFFGQTAGRMTQSFSHARSIWWYLPILPALFFPWFVWPETWRAIGALRAAPRDAGVRFCVASVGAGLAAFSLISGKQAHYLLPLAPACALLVARGLSSREAAPLRRPWLVAGVTAILAGVVLVAATTTRLAARTLWWPHPPIAWGWAALTLVLAVMLIIWQRGRITRNAAVHSLAVTTAVLLCALQLAAVRAATIPYDTSRMAVAVKAALAAGHPIAMVGTYNGEYHYPARLSGIRIEVVSATEAPAWLLANPAGLLLRYDRGRNPLVIDGIVARFPFRNGWATLSSTLPKSLTAPAPSAELAP